MKKLLLSLTVVVLSLGILVVIFTRHEAPPPPEPKVQEAEAPTRDTPTFQLRIKKPRMSRPLFGLLPTAVERAFEDPGPMRIDEESPGAWVGEVDEGRLALGSDAWDLRIEAAEDGAILVGTQLVISLTLAEKPRTLRCRPADPAVGYLRASPREGTEGLDGELMVKLATCENTATGKVIEWPPAPLTLRGSFSGLVSGTGPASAPTAF